MTDFTVPDPRDVTTEQVGTKIRDAAVTPRATDFLPPSHAGEAGQAGNPHGPNVVSPGLHGDESVRAIATGDVSSDPDEQETAEMASLAESQPQTAPAEEPPAEG